MRSRCTGLCSALLCQDFQEPADQAQVSLVAVSLSLSLCVCLSRSRILGLLHHIWVKVKLIGGYREIGFVGYSGPGRCSLWYLLEACATVGAGQQQYCWVLVQSTVQQQTTRDTSAMSAFEAVLSSKKSLRPRWLH